MKEEFAGNAISQELKSYLIENVLIGSSDEALQPDDSFLQKGILDSTGILEIIEFIERRYGIKFADDEITPENLDSLNLIAAFIAKKLNKR
jgi:acyl carrier protein